MLGFPGALGATLRSEYGEPAPAYVSLSEVQCNGTEDSIYACPHESISYCSKSRSAGVQCLGMYVVLWLKDIASYIVSYTIIKRYLV